MFASRSNGSECLNTVECYDPTVNRWFSIAPMKVARKGLSVVAYDNVIYAISGENDSTTLCSMEVYREDADEWEFSAYLQTGRKEFGAAVVPVSIDQLSKM
ncbi:hypothetical protein Y032_0024g901 [Ancylostoma ceylanicum]|uniref:Kelch repeat protein n=1 Tax=Ancylostoma ceylanicum TaxID=53326 RepID=A0A016UWD1_9BILA|nr:hypothetical protein Y032_0024g901 [Ancylostoma ceylanicum]